MDGHSPHRRYNPLLDEWVLVSPQRTERPWLGQEEGKAQSQPSYDPDCYLCPGNLRANGERNPSYEGTFVFPNDFPALLPGGQDQAGGSLLKSKSVRGDCRVICYSPNHGATLAQMGKVGIESVVNLWCDQTSALGQDYEWVQVFENKGATMGCSNPHPHGQIWATDQTPTIPQRESVQQATYFTNEGTDLLGDVLIEEDRAQERIVCANDEWVAWVPFWAEWPFETLVAPLRKAARLSELNQSSKEGLADLLSLLLPAYDRLFGVSMPYSMGWHGAPFRRESDGWRVHAHFFPPLLRSATVRKFMVGYEM
ncbi:MAG: UDP-glucose--hexose-1-phosphate uridylyltransferase, partial [Fimbriimonadaceae bacterium]|nr:UDP-glucose--hexose-1-phosphate uridylyltransferase [Fimbriimonadaceae bacterium]